MVSGTHTDGTPVDAVLKFYHACNDDKLEVKDYLLDR
ncbi:unnamed protein product [Anisakis simplex]|uniref:Uncharacterized protein n=1 Tax=Anisakis simplex TaxID=6269 RepID=A0A3P6P7I3_ANISI|nr:unnamed protein product [Anisakis simplex]